MERGLVISVPGDVFYTAGEQGQDSARAGICYQRIGVSPWPPSCAQGCHVPRPPTRQLVAGDLRGGQPHDAAQAGAHHDHGHKQAAADGGAGRKRSAQRVPGKHDQQGAVVEAAVGAAREEVLDGVVAWWVGGRAGC